MENPLPVPKYMRTRLSLPRTIAGIVSCVSLAVFTLGTQALAKRQLEAQTGFERVLADGKHHWGSYQEGAGKSCTAYFDTNFQLISVKASGLAKKNSKKLLSETREFNLEGALAVLHNQKPAVASISLRSTFDVFLGLAAFSLNLSVGQEKYSIITNLGEHEIRLSHSDSVTTNSFTLPRPEPIYLQKAGNGYRLNLPQTLPAAAKQLLKLGPLENSYVELKKVQLEDCQKKMQLESLDHSRLLNISTLINTVNLLETSND